MRFALGAKSSQSGYDFVIAVSKLREKTYSRQFGSPTAARSLSHADGICKISIFVIMLVIFGDSSFRQGIEISEAFRSR